MSMQKDVTVLTERGQTSIPASLRRELELVRGQQLLWQKVGERELKVVILERPRPRGAEAMRGFARRFRRQPRTTASWMEELREGER